IAIASVRLELLANELQEERLRITQMFLYALFGLFCFGMGILLLTVFIVVLFWDTQRLAVLAVLCVLFFVASILMALWLRNKAQARPKLFSASLAELAKDREYLGGSHE
ncbi:MAG TPA: phage holin family protein, partial [Gallionella sp.]|nr:phage holin family protein [Gallionella sp.]